MSVGEAQAIHAMPIPETVLGGGYHCPGCGVPFLSQRDPQVPTDRAVYTGISVDFDGSLILCEPCVKYLASLVGMVDMETGKARTSDVRRAQRREAGIREANQTVEHAIDALATAGQALLDMQQELVS